MPRFMTAVLALNLAYSVTAQSNTIVSVFLLDSDPEPLVASVVGQGNSLTTLAVNCADADADACGYPSGLALTYGPSTVHLVAASGGITGEVGCQLTGTIGGTCSVTYIGAATDLTNVIEPTSPVTDTAVTTVSTDASLTQGDITLAAVTITAGALSASDNTASNAASSVGSSQTSQTHTSATGSHSESHSESHTEAPAATSKQTTAQGSSTTSHAYSTPTTTPNVANQLIVPGMIGAALLGLAAYM